MGKGYFWPEVFYQGKATTKLNLINEAYRGLLEADKIEVLSHAGNIEELETGMYCAEERIDSWQTMAKILIKMPFSDSWKGISKHLFTKIDPYFKANFQKEVLAGIAENKEKLEFFSALKS